MTKNVELNIPHKSIETSDEIILETSYHSLILTSEIRVILSPLESRRMARWKKGAANTRKIKVKAQLVVIFMQWQQYRNTGTQDKKDKKENEKAMRIKEHGENERENDFSCHWMVKIKVKLEN